MEVLNQTLGGLQSGLHSTIGGSNAYTTPSIRHEARVINNGVDHIRLDNTFLDRCQKWRDNFPQRQLATERCEASQASHRGMNFLNSYATGMQTDRIAKLQDNQVRENHEWAMKGITGVRSEFQPLANSSHERVGQFCDWIGVTDRYTGYRNNLSRGRGPLNYDPAWRRGDDISGHQLKFTPEITPDRRNARFNLRTRSAPLTHRPTTGCYNQNGQQCQTRQAEVPFRTPQEAAGIEVNYPGKTEYKDRYKRPCKSAAGFSYEINPTPNFGLIGRPVMPATIDERITEYKYSYEWPSAAKYPSLPWLKKK